MKKILTLAFAGAAPLAVASPAMAANVTIDWQKPSQTTSQINTGESVTWNVVESGHNVNVYQGPETFKSTSGKDAKGTQFSHVFNTPGTYKFICDYHSSMKGTITVAAVQQPAPGGSPSPAPQPAPGGGPQPTTGSAPVGPAGQAAAVDGAAPTVHRVSLSHSALRVRLSEPAKLTIRYRKVGAKRVQKKV